MPKTSTERVKAFRERMRLGYSSKQAPKSGAQRAREFRARRKAMKNAAAAGVPLLIPEMPTISILQSTEPSTSYDALNCHSRNTGQPLTNFKLWKAERKMKGNVQTTGNAVSLPPLIGNEQKFIAVLKKENLIDTSLPDLRISGELLTHMKTNVLDSQLTTTDSQSAIDDFQDAENCKEIFLNTQAPEIRIKEEEYIVSDVASEITDFNDTNNAEIFQLDQRVEDPINTDNLNSSYEQELRKTNSLLERIAGSLEKVEAISFANLEEQRKTAEIMMSLTSLLNNISEKFTIKTECL